MQESLEWRNLDVDRQVNLLLPEQFIAHELLAMLLIASNS